MPAADVGVSNSPVRLAGAVKLSLPKPRKAYSALTVQLGSIARSTPAPSIQPQCQARCAAPRQPGSAARHRAGPGVRQRKAGLAVDERSLVERQRPSEAPRKGAHRVREGTAVRADEVSRIGKAGLGAVHVGPAEVRLQAVDDLAALPVVPELATDQGTGRAHRVAVDRGTIRVGDIDEAERTADMQSDIASAPVEPSRSLGSSRCSRQPRCNREKNQKRIRPPIIGIPRTDRDRISRFERAGQNRTPSDIRHRDHRSTTFAVTLPAQHPELCGSMVACTEQRRVGSRYPIGQLD